MNTLLIETNRDAANPQQKLPMSLSLYLNAKRKTAAFVMTEVRTGKQPGKEENQILVSWVLGGVSPNILPQLTLVTDQSLTRKRKRV